MNDKLLVMKKLILILCVFGSIGVFGQTTTNKDLIKEVNRELGVDNWSIRGDNVYIENETGGMGNGYWGISKVKYSLKYQYWNVGGGVGQNIYVLYVECKEEEDCIGDLEDSYFIKVMNLGLSDDEKRANRVLELLNKLQ